MNAKNRAVKPSPNNADIEEIAVAEADREKKNWFALNRDERQFYIDRVTRIIDAWSRLSN